MKENVLYYTWGELNKNDAINAFAGLGYRVTEFKSCHTKYDYDENNMHKLEKMIENMTDVSFVFSFNYFPDVSRVAQKKNIIYISWVYDCPHYTLESETLNNECNRVFIFDSELAAKYEMLGINTVQYMPLPARIISNAFDGNGPASFMHDISFVGTMYDGDRDLYGQINSLPAMLKGKLDGYVMAQHLMYGCDLLGELINESSYFEIKKYVNNNLGAYYRECDKEIFINIMKRRVTMLDRINALRLLGGLIDMGALPAKDIGLYCEKSHPELPVKNMGYADHETKLPQVLVGSRVNLNISLRSIDTGVPLRVMHILGAGGFCLTNYQSDLERHFENGRELVWYYNEDDLVEKIQYYLTNDREREEIARKGYEKAKECFSYSALLTEIMKKSGVWKE